jgi:hypothetical protein
MGLINLLREENKNNRVNIVEFVKKASKLMKQDDSTNEKKIQMLVQALKQIGKGNDGIFGTDDDLIPKTVVDEIQKMETTSILTDLVTVFVNKKSSRLHRLILCFKCYHSFT